MALGGRRRGRPGTTGSPTAHAWSGTRWCASVRRCRDDPPLAERGHGQGGATSLAALHTEPVRTRGMRNRTGLALEAVRAPHIDSSGQRSPGFRRLGGLNAFLYAKGMQGQSRPKESSAPRNVPFTNCQKWDIILGEHRMPYEVPLPKRIRARGWKVKIREKDGVEPPHVTVMHHEDEWRSASETRRCWSRLGEGSRTSMRRSCESSKSTGIN